MGKRPTITEETDALIGRDTGGAVGDSEARSAAEEALAERGRARPKPAQLPDTPNPTGALASGIFDFVAGINDRNWQREQTELEIRKKEAQKNLNALNVAAATNATLSAQSKISQARNDANGDAGAFQKNLQEIYQTTVNSLPAGARGVFSNQYLGMSSNAFSSYTAEQQRANFENNKELILSGLERQQNLSLQMFSGAETAEEKNNAVAGYYASVNAALESGAISAESAFAYKTDFDQTIAAKEISSDAIARINSGGSVSEIRLEIQNQGLAPEVIEMAVKGIDDWVASTNAEATRNTRLATQVKDVTVDGLVALGDSQGATAAMAHVATLRQDGKVSEAVYAETVRLLGSDRRNQEGLRLAVFSQANSETLTESVITDAWRAVAITRDEYLALQRQYETQNLAKRGDVKASLSIITYGIEKSYGGALSAFNETSARTPMKQAESEYLSMRQKLEETGEWQDAFDAPLQEQLLKKYQNPDGADKIEAVTDRDLESALQQADADLALIRETQQRLKLLDLSGIDTTPHQEDIAAWQLLQEAESKR